MVHSNLQQLIFLLAFFYIFQIQKFQYRFYYSELSRLSGILAENGIGIFAVSTYNTDYILVKKENFDRAMRVLSEAGYHFREDSDNA